MEKKNWNSFGFCCILKNARREKIKRWKQQKNLTVCIRRKTNIPDRNLQKVVEKRRKKHAYKRRFWHSHRCFHAMDEAHGIRIWCIDGKTDETEGKTSSPATDSDGWRCPPRLLLCCRRKTGSYVTLVRQVTLAARQSFFPLFGCSTQRTQTLTTHWRHPEVSPPLRPKGRKHYKMPKFCNTVGLLSKVL